MKFDRTRTSVSRRTFLQVGGTGAVVALSGCPNRHGREDVTSTDIPIGSTATSPVEQSRPPVHMLTDYTSQSWDRLWFEQLIPTFEDETNVGVRPDFGRRFHRFRQLIDHHDWPDVNTSSFAHLCHLEANRDLAPVNDLFSEVRRQNGELIVDPHPSPPGEEVQVPFGYQAETLLYRTDIYADLGLDVPTTFEELLANARAIEESDRDISGYQVAGGVPVDGLNADRTRREFQAFLARMGLPPTGLRYRDPDDGGDLEIHFPKSAVTTLLEFLGKLASHSAIPLAEHDRPSSSQWIEGEVAQLLHRNNWPASIAAYTTVRNDEGDFSELVETTGVAPLPYWEAGGVNRSDAWLGKPFLDAFHVFEPGDNTPGARRWLEWLFADEFDRTARLYNPQPTRTIPNYEGILGSDAYRQNDLFQAFPGLLEQVDYINETVIGEHYYQRPTETVDTPIGLYVGQQPFYAEMVVRVVTGESSVEAAYEFGRGRLEARLVEARERLDR